MTRHDELPKALHAVNEALKALREVRHVPTTPQAAGDAFGQLTEGMRSLTKLAQSMAIADGDQSADPAEQQRITTRPVLADPVTRHEHDENGNAYDPFVRWDLSFGCTVNIATTGDDLAVLVSTSDRDQAAGVTQRAVTREQVADYACQVLALVGETSAQIERMALAMFNRNHPGRDYDADAGEAERALHRKDARAAFDALTRTASEDGTAEHLAEFVQTRGDQAGTTIDGGAR